MKKIMSLLGAAVLGALMLITSCTKTPAGGNTESKLEGKWKLTKEVAELYADGKLVDEEVFNVANLSSVSFYFEFFSNGTFNALGTLPGEDDAAGSGTYSVFDNRLVLTYSGSSDLDTGSFIIDSISSKELILTIDTDEYEEEGVHFEVAVKLHFEKM